MNGLHRMAGLTEREMRLFDMERNRIYVGDCVRLAKDLSDGEIDLAVASPPYDDLRDYNSSVDYDSWYAKQAEERLGKFHGSKSNEEGAVGLWW